MKLSDFKLSNYKKLFLKEVIFQLFEKFLRIVIGLIVIKKLTEYFGPSSFGIFNFVESYFMIFYGLSIFGLDIILVRKLKEDDSDKIIGNAFTILSISTLLFFSLSILVLSLFFNSLKQELLLIVSIGLIFNPLYVIECYLVSKNKIRITSIFKSISFLIKSVLILSFIFYNLNLKTFILAIIIESFTYYIFLLFYFLSLRRKLSFHFDMNIIKELVQPSIFICLYSLGNIIYFRIDIFMIEYFLSDYEMGIYTAAYKLLNFTFFIPAIISNTLFPRIIEITNLGQSNTKSLSRMYKVSFFISVLIFLFIFFFSDILVNNLFGPEFNQSIYILKIIAFNVVIISVSSIYFRIIYSHNLESRLLLRILIGIALNIILNLLLIQTYGLSGVAISTLLSLIILESIYDFFDHKLIKHHVFKFKSIFNL
jgi:O-antigen/teichoic acid export membrane protein